MGFKAIFRKIGGFFKGTALGIYDAVVELVSSEQAQALLKSALGNIVQQAVVEVQELPNLHGWEKRGEALKRIAERAKGEGIQYKNSVVGLLLEMVVTRMKALGESLEK